MLIAMSVFFSRVVRGSAVLMWAATLVLAQNAQPAKAAAKVPSGPDQPTAPSKLPDGNQAVDDMNGQYIKVWRAIMAPKNVADAFGRRIAKRYIAVQVSIANRNKDYQWLIQDASIDLRPLLLAANTRGAACEGQIASILDSLTKGFDPKVSSADLTVLRGVAEKGQALDPRNVALRVLTGAGVIGAGLIGVTTFGPSFAPAVAAFNGPLISAFKEVFPDYTVEQLNRLNDSAYLANTIVGKQQAKVLVMFVPQSYFLTKSEQKDFYNNPEKVYGCVDVRLLAANVDGNFVAAVSGTP
jgi:hypothetical protein